MMTPLVQGPDPRAVSLAAAPCQSSATGGGRRALGHRLRGSLDEMARADPVVGPGAGAYKTSQPPPSASRTAQNRPAGMRGIHQSGEQSGRPRNGTKRARIGKASGSTDRSFGPDAVGYMSVTIATSRMNAWL
jgi:hypothetical protein